LEHEYHGQIRFTNESGKGKEFQGKDKDNHFIWQDKGKGGKSSNGEDDVRATHGSSSTASSSTAGHPPPQDYAWNTPAAEAFRRLCDEQLGNFLEEHRDEQGKGKGVSTGMMVDEDDVDKKGPDGRTIWSAATERMVDLMERI